MKEKEAPPKRILVSAQEIAYCLTYLGDAQHAITRKVYPVAVDRIRQTAVKLREMLGIEG